MNTSFPRFAAALSLLVATAVATTTFADPLPGRDRLKFSQQPMVQTQILNDNGVLDDYFGHDELSTAYRQDTAPAFQGRFMADDFADNLNSPILHVKWWGSYMNAQGPQDPNMPVDRFLISFESDVPQDATNTFSHPGQPLLNQVVSRGPLAPGSGTFTEKLIRGPDPILGESLYEYNAELHLGKAFPEVKDTVYWLKIVALVNAPGVMFDPFNPPPGITQWGWHNRDYSIQNTLASPNVVGPPFPPGEAIVGQVGPAVQPTPVWHFQDDAVSGNIRITPGPAGMMMPVVDQWDMHPELYKDFLDGPGSAIPGATGIGQFSKDLAFELYTYAIPEPASGLMFAIGIVGLAIGRRRPAEG